MPIDFSKLATDYASTLIEPRDIFASLGNRPWPRLRVEQDQVLNTWFTRRSESDLVIKQNTGSGKTVVGLLIAQSSLSEGIGPVAYVAPDTYLVNQVVEEAKGLGLKVTTDAKDDDFLSSKAILICTFEKIVNGRTVFGLLGDANRRTLGTIVIDDAHSALGAARKQFTFHIPPHHPAFSKALALFGEELKRQSYQHAVDLLDNNRSAPLRIPFWSWADKYSVIYNDVKSTVAERDEAGGLVYPEMYFSWPLVADYFRLCNATISNRGLQIRPPCPPIDHIPAFHQAKRRVYLTATLSDDGVLVTEFGANADSVRVPITPARATDLGDRLILAPAALNPGIVEDSVRQLAFEFASGDRKSTGRPDSSPINVVVLVPSDRAAETWRKYTNLILHVSDMKPYIDRMSKGEHLGLVVLVNKYDGIDLPDNACRLLILDGIPTSLDPAEQREAGALSGSRSSQIRKIQRIEQGMGRGIRDAEDYCAVLLMGKELALSLVNPGDLDIFSPATSAQIKFSQKVSEQIRDKGLDSVRETLSIFLERDEQWKKASSAATAGVAYASIGHVSGVAEARRKAWDLASSGDPDTAAKVLNKALNKLDPMERGWYLEEVASYQHEVSPMGAQKTIKQAKQANKSTLMPTAPLIPGPLRGRAQQAQAASQYLSETYQNGTELQLKIQSFLDDLAFESAEERVEAAEAAIKLLGLHLGINASRPEKDFGKGPDGCWALTPECTAVIELKTGTTREDEAIIKSETDQLAGALSWNGEHNDSQECIPVLVSRSSKLHYLASAPLGTRVITEYTLESLKKNVLSFAAEIINGEAWKQPDSVADALQQYGLTAKSIILQHSVKPSRPDDSL